MNLHIRFVFVIYLLLTAGNSFAQPDTTFHIYLMFGQSNMEGQGTVEPRDRVTNPRVFVLQDSTCPNLGREYGHWYIAEPPLNRCWGKLGPGDSFGRMLGEKAPSWVTKIGLVNVSVSGCNIYIYKKGCPNGLDANSQGIPFNCGYTWLLDLAKKASQAGVIKGIIFHQGETNTGDPNWKYTVQKIIADLKSDLGLGDIPFLAGELLHSEYNSCCSAHNTEINKLPGLIPNTHVISAWGLPGSDPAHFTSAAYRDLGERYGRKMLNLVYGICDSTTFESWFKYNGVMQKSNTIKVQHGTQLTLSPQPSNLPGKWSWKGAGTAGTNREQTIMVPAGGIDTAVVTYTNECGATSRLPFIIKVCDSANVESWYKITGGEWTSSNTLSILRYANVILRPVADDTTGSWSWSGAGLSGTSQQQQFNTSFAGKYTALATYTNGCGAKSRLTIRISVCDSTKTESRYHLDGSESLPSDSIHVTQNALLILSPKPYTGGTWLWSGAATGTTREQIFNTQTPGTFIARAAYTNACGIVSHMTVKIVVEEPVAINEVTTDEIELFPNPAGDRLYVTIGNGLQSPQGIILNETGGIVMWISLRNGPDNTIDISSLNPGIYLLKVITDRHTMVSRFVKAK